MTEDARKVRWRLVLGPAADEAMGRCQGSWEDCDNAVGFLYDREYSKRNVRRGGRKSRGDSKNKKYGETSLSGKDEDESRNTERSASLAETSLTVPEWINKVHELFPRKAIERLERDALERYQLEELLTNPEVLERAQPSPSILKAVLRTKHLMNAAVLAAARVLIHKTVEELMAKLARQVQSPFLGAVDRRRRSYLKVAKNLDVTTTIKRNLKLYNQKQKRLFIETPYFFSRIKRKVDMWRVIIVVDQSGSMIDSVIHSAVTASIFFGMKLFKTHLIAFDTNIVDLTESCGDPVETLMAVQLGGGTDIGQAVGYASSLIDDPGKTIVILITDFYEGAPENILVNAVKQMVESGVTFLGLASLDYNAYPVYDKVMAQRLANLGAHIAAMTPGELAAWVAEKVR